MRRRFTWRAALVLAAVVSALGVASVAGAGPPWTPISTDFASPLFGLAVAPDHSLVVADTGAGPTAVRGGETSLIAELPGVTDVAPIGRGDMLALTTEFGPGQHQALYRVSQGRTTMVADLLAFEEAVDPADDGVESNTFDLARLNGGKTLVADAAGNSILVVDEQGSVDWVAALPQHPITCPAGFCGPEPVPGFPADPVPTTVAVGPDGAYYVGELTGFPGNPGESRVWRIEPGTRHARCGSSPACSIVATGFTSIIDIAFGADGKAYVVELDEASWLALEGFGTPLGGTVNACTPGGATWSCTERATGLPIPTAVALDGSTLYATIFGLVPGDAAVVSLP